VHPIQKGLFIMYHGRIVFTRALLGFALIAGLGAADDGLPFSPALPPPVGRIDVSAGAADPVEVHVDGELMTRETPDIVTVPAGEYDVVLRKEGFADFVQRVSVEPLETVTLRAELVRE
jgi:hypothetical protein